MITQTVTVTERSTQNIIIGRRGTYNTEEIIFDLTYLIETYGAGQAVLMVKRPTDETAYPAVTTQTDGQLIWVVSDVDTSFKGHGECELYWYVEQALAKSVIFGVAILRDIGASSEIPPDPYKPWVDVLVELGAETERNAEAAAASASDAAESADAAEDAQEAAEAAVEHYPKIVDGYWYVWSNGEWVNTGTKAAGTDGKGISSIVSVKTSTSGNIDTYTMTVTYTDGTTETLTFTVTNGVSPSVTITPIAHGHQVTITDAEHPTGQTFEVLDGEVTEAELDEVKDTITQLDNTKAPVIVDTASGSIASFPDGADGMPVKDLTVSIEPIQDLHGYDSPWPAGGGVNKLNPANLVPTGTVYGLDISIDGDVITISGTYTGTLSTPQFRSFTYMVDGVATPMDFTLKGFPETSADSEHYYLVDKADSGTKVSIALKNMVTDTAYSIKLRLVGYEGTAPTAWSPYSNLCPISGRTGCEVQRTGKNLCYGVLPKAFTIATGEILDAAGMCLLFKCKKGETYTFSGVVNNRSIFAIFDNPPEVGSVANYFGSIQGSKTVTASRDGYGLFYVANSVIDTSTAQIELGSTASAYEQYRGETIPISWQTEAGTVYGGTATYNGDGTWTLVAEYAEDDLGSLTWSRLHSTSYNSDYFSAFLTSTPTTGFTDCINSVYQLASGQNALLTTDNRLCLGGTWASGRVLVRDDSYETAQAFKTAMDGQQVVYKLATPLTYTITTSELLTTLLGQNNIWTDCGDVSVDYPADTKLYIDKKLAALVAALS